MQLPELVNLVADILKGFDSENPKHNRFQPGIGPFGEPQLIKEIALWMSKLGLPAQTRRAPDLEIGEEWAVEFKIIRPFGDNGKEAENWSQNLLHPYEGNVSLIGDALKLMGSNRHKGACLFAICYEHQPPEIELDPLIASFELIATTVNKIPLSDRFEERRGQLVHPIHQTLRCVAWQLTDTKLP